MPDLAALIDAAKFIAAAYPGIWTSDTLRYLIGAGGVFLTINLALSGVLRGRKIRPTSPRAVQMRREFFTSLRTAAIFAAAGGLIVAALVNCGIVVVYADPAERGWDYFAFTLIALIVVHDAYFYWTHRLIHHPHLFRRVHCVHHRSNNPSPWTAYSFNTAEAVLNAIFMPLMNLVMPLSIPAIIIFLSHMMLRNAIGHCGYELFPARRDGRPLFDWLTTVTHHDLHHAHAAWNYGLYFTFWDRMMGTEHPLYHEKFAHAVRKPLLDKTAGERAAV